MSQLPVTQHIAASHPRNHTLLWIQVAISSALVVASVAQLGSEWNGMSESWIWSSVTATLALALLVIAVTTARTRHTLQQDLDDTAGELRAAETSVTVGDEALRVSELSNASSDEELRLSVAAGLQGAEALRASVAHGIAGDEELRLSVAAGLVGDEALRQSVANGIAGEEKLRLSVAAGLVGKEALRLSVASGLEGAEALRVSVANEAEGVEALRVSVANEIAGDEKLRLSVAAGLVGAEALRVSVANAIEGAEALRVSIAQGIDAASTTLAVVDTVDAAITLYAPDGHILLTNDTARTLATLARSGELDPHEFGDDRVTVIPRFDQVLARAARGQLVTRRAYWVGTGYAQRAIMSTSQYVKRASGELIGTVVASHDVTPLARTRDEFLETVSHELRTPLTSMIGYLELIEDSLDLSEVGIAQEFEVLQRNTNRLLRLINDLLLTAQGDAPTDKRPFDLVELAGKAVQAIQQHAHQLKVDLAVAESEPVIAEIDADQISDVLDKVLSNALKFNRPGGRITLTCSSDGSFALITIADTGIGMSAEDQKRMFERFYRAPSIRTDLIAGVGLGLSAAKLIIDAHHGSITAASAPGVGTTVEILLPLVAPGQAELTPGQPELTVSS